MCTMLIEKTKVQGSGKGSKGWFKFSQANVSFDHPSHLHIDYSINIDFIQEVGENNKRIAIELTPESAKNLIETISKSLRKGSDMGLKV
ncbi:MAG: DUF6295 family protein [Dehalococcoidia bacterium]